MLSNKKLIDKRKRREDKRKAKRRDVFIKKAKDLKGSKLRSQIEYIKRLIALNNKVVDKIETEPVSVLQAGDVVKLKRGSVKMTVVAIKHDVATCKWYKEESERENKFSVKILDRVTT